MCISANKDYEPAQKTCTFSESATTCDIEVEIIDDFMPEMNEYFSLLLKPLDPEACSVGDDNITITIIDDGKSSKYLSP